jgi:hypothetical protein
MADNKSLDDKKRLIPKKNLANWEPDDKLKEAIERSWGLSNVRTAEPRSGQSE